MTSFSMRFPWRAAVAAGVLLGLALPGHPEGPPVAIPGCILWLDAIDTDGDGAADTVQDGRAVSQWVDRSGQGHDAAQSEETRQPRQVASGPDGIPVLRLDGNDVLVCALTRSWSAEDCTVFAVASLNPDAPNNWRGIIGNRFGPGRANWWTLGTKSDGTLYLELTPGVGVNTSARPAASGCRIYSFTKHLTSFVLFQDGQTLGAAEKDNTGDLSNELRIGQWFGDGQEWDGEIAEVLIYDHALADPERMAVERYLARKWAVSTYAHGYVRKGAWPETMLASRDAIRRWADSARSAGPPDTVTLREQEQIALVWSRIAADFPRECAWMARECGERHLEWFTAGASTALEQEIITRAGSALRARMNGLVSEGARAEDPRWLSLCVEAAQLRDRFLARRDELECVDLRALRKAIDDLSGTFGERYGNGRPLAAEFAGWQSRLPQIAERLGVCDDDAFGEAAQFLAWRSDVLLANPLLDFERLLIVKRGLGSPSLGLPQNWQSNCILPRSGFDDEIALLSPIRGPGAITTLYRPQEPVFVGDVDLHFSGERLLFSSIGSNGCWQIFEVGIDGSGLRQVTPGDQPDVDSYDPCYLPNGDILFSSNAYYAAVPCVNGLARTAVLYRMDSEGRNIRQISFDQEHNWCPTVLPNGRILYLRWEYTDTPHSHDRVLFHMNPDGTGQMEYYGSNSYWPNSLFYARPTPGNANRFVGIVGGHHGVPRMGELVLFDTGQGRRESDGAIQRVCTFPSLEQRKPEGFGLGVHSTTNPKYESSLIQDQLVDDSWPKYLHPYPLNEKYFLVSCKPAPDALWGIYLVDVFNNMVLLREEPGFALLEPIPVGQTAIPPVVPDRVDPESRVARVYLTDVYAGEGLKDIPRGTVKALRVFTYHFLYPNMGGPQAVVGMEGPWDIKRIMGTIPVEEDGSAFFEIPANTPVSVQPLDEKGQALQLMRSWFTGMRGETLSCVGCHESQSSTAPVRPTTASRRAPSPIAPWHGPERGFNFDREVQPVLDRYCAVCHDGTRSELPNLKERAHITDYSSVFHHGGVDAGHFSVTYAELHRFVRRPGLESDYHLLMPMEYHANTTQLVQMLRRGHHNVRLDEESWDRLITWIDLNAPFHGTWTEIAGADRVAHPAQRRRELLKLYANMESDPEAIPPIEKKPMEPVTPEPDPATPSEPVSCEGWPFDAAEAARRQQKALAILDAPLSSGDAEATPQWVLDLGGGVTMNLVLVPAGSFVMGSVDGHADERPAARVVIEEPFWIGRCEITNGQFERFDPAHDSRVESRFSMQFGVRGFYVNGPEQPVVRVSWDHAMRFCQWLSEKTGRSFTLPTEAQWEYACRAGTSTPFYFGDRMADFSSYANLADQKLREFVCHTYKKEREPWLHASKYDDWIPKDLRFNDNGFLSDSAGQYLPNAFGLCDMIGNVWEWTRTSYRPYPYDENDGRNDAGVPGDRAVRGGSWRDRPADATASARLPYRPYQGVFNVGFRVVCPASGQ